VLDDADGVNEVEGRVRIGQAPRVLEFGHVVAQADPLDDPLPKGKDLPVVEIDGLEGWRQWPESESIRSGTPLTPERARRQRQLRRQQPAWDSRLQ